MQVGDRDDVDLHPRFRRRHIGRRMGQEGRRGERGGQGIRDVARPVGRGRIMRERRRPLRPGGHRQGRLGGDRRKLLGAVFGDRGRQHPAGGNGRPGLGRDGGSCSPASGVTEVGSAAPMVAGAPGCWVTAGSCSASGSGPTELGRCAPMAAGGAGCAVTAEAAPVGRIAEGRWGSSCCGSGWAPRSRQAVRPERVGRRLQARQRGPRARARPGRGRDGVRAPGRRGLLRHRLGMGGGRAAGPRRPHRAAAQGATSRRAGPAGRRRWASGRGTMIERSGSASCGGATGARVRRGAARCLMRPR